MEPLPKVEPVERQVYNCFFKVIDISTNGKRTEDRGQCLRNRELESFYRTVPPQSSNTIRLILDGRHRRFRFPGRASRQSDDVYPKCASLLASNRVHHIPSPNPLYTNPAVIDGSFKYYHLPTLRRLTETNVGARWYGVYCFAAHIDDCPSRSRQLHPLQSTFERSDAYWTVCKNNEELLTVICYAPDAFATPPDLRLQDYHCANANWRFLKELDEAFSKSTILSDITNASEKQMLQLVLLKIAFANLEQTAKFLDYISSRMDDEDWRILPRNVFALRESRLVDMLGKRIVVLRTVEDVMVHMSGAIACISKSFRILPNQDGEPISAQVNNYIDDVQQDCEYYKSWAQQLKSKSMEIHEVTVQRYSVKQASSVSQLTLLAAFFLPLSLAAGVLSMQTRFASLNLLLYDFVGVVVILATLGLVVGLIIRYGLDFFKLMVQGQQSQSSRFDSAKLRVMRVLFMCLWWMAILSSFLVGMIKDVVFGLKIFGYEAAGIAVTGWVSYGLSECMARRRGMR